MTALALALALLAQAPDAATPSEAARPEVARAEAAPAPLEDRLPNGAPRDDYPFVAWCYGVLRGYLDLKPEMMPEVTRIENQFRKPGTRLADDLKVYDDMAADGKVKLKLFQSALTAAERASVRPINAQGAQFVRVGRQIWNTSAEITEARKAQEWMGWALPQRCETVAASLEVRSNLLGASLQANTPADAVTEPDPPASK